MRGAELYEGGRRGKNNFHIDTKEHPSRLFVFPQYFGVHTYMHCVLS